jgi:hypothetical protein
MNQGIAFARTIRALDADDFRTSKLMLFVAAAVLAGWAWWMVAAQVPQYEVTTDVRLVPEGAIASFPASAVNRLYNDQRAVLHFATVSVPAQVSQVTSEANGTVHVELRLFANPQSLATNPGEARSVELEVSRRSPASIALRSLGRADP